MADSSLFTWLMDNAVRREISLSVLINNKSASGVLLEEGLFTCVHSLTNGFKKCAVEQPSVLCEGVDRRK